ncbi:hypothetical protein PCO85_11120 [Prodigiosinella aquatilis]|nr:hypothetical protein [Prodigiosinella sp. LS101]WJV55885.1 hypothetical protein PCO85_11120 [Prodigiosinella sp. LS101]WJV60247.1 hypothetical protein PCO84_11120 [Pectobacteriaceae bacterium C111]
MLTTALQQSVKIPVNYLGIREYAYTCYGDSIDKNIYYVVPEIPVFVSLDGRPSFMFYKYRSNEQQGGYAQFTVMLPQPTDEIKDKICVQLFGGISTQLAAKSKLIVTYVKAEQAYKADPADQAKKDAMTTAQRNASLNDEQASTYVALYDSSKGDDQFLGQLMPEDAKKIKLLQPRYTASQASLILDDNKAFYRQIPTSLSPSGLGDNNTVFSLSLTGEGATLFEKVLKGTDQNASVGIRFNFNLDASLPAAKVTVSYDSEKTKAVTQTIDRHTWSADEKKIEREYIEKGAITIDVFTGLTAAEMGMSQDQYLKWKEGLSAWGQKQIEQILSSQTGLDMSLDLLNDTGGFDKFKESLKDTQSFTRIYEENSVVSFAIAPQTQLPSIKSIVGEAQLSEYFKEYDLNDPFYQYLQPEFYVTHDLAKYNVATIVVTAKYDKDNVNTLVFDPTNSQPKKTDKWFIKPELGRSYSYSYIVNFSGMHAKPYRSGEILVTDNLVETINVAQCGIVYADISTLIDPIGWKTFKQVVVKTQYSDSSHGIEPKIDSQIVTAASNDKIPSFIYPIGIKVDNPVFYTATYYTEDGNNLTYIPAGANTDPQMPGYGLTRANQIQIANALPRSQDYTIIFQQKRKDIQLITFEMVVNYPNHNFKQTQNIVLTEFTTPTIIKILNFNLMPQEADNAPQSDYTAMVYLSDGSDPKVITGKVAGNIIVVPC